MVLLDLMILSCFASLWIKNVSHVKKNIFTQLHDLKLTADDFLLTSNFKISLKSFEV